MAALPAPCLQLTRPLSPPVPARPLSPLQAGCTCDICTGHMPHAELVQRMSRSVFCPIIASNTQSSRRLSEAVLTGEGGWAQSFA